MKCKDCEYLKVTVPDALNEGFAYCTKYEVSTWLIGNRWKKKIERLDCYGEQMGDDGK